MLFAGVAAEGARFSRACLVPDVSAGRIADTDELDILRGDDGTQSRIEEPTVRDLSDSV